jgi:hypothetical protein
MSNMSVLISHPRGVALGILMTISTKSMVNDVFIKLILKALLHELIGIIARQVFARDHSECSHRRPSPFAHRRCGSIYHLKSVPSCCLVPEMADGDLLLLW